MLSPWLYAPTEPRARLLWFAVATLVAAALGVRAYMTAMKNISPFVRNLLILAVIAAAVVVLNQEVALSVVGALVRVAFFIAIAVVAYLFWRDFGRREIAIWPAPAQAVFYAAVALLVVDLGVWFIATRRAGRDALALIVVARDLASTPACAPGATSGACSS